MTGLTFTISGDTEFYGEISVGMKIEIEHTEDQALYIQSAEEEGIQALRGREACCLRPAFQAGEHRAGSGPSRARSLLHPDYLISC